MPSGHIMTATLNFTIIMNNYPEQAYWLRPFEYVWLTLLGFEMMNNGVHWASDYPIGIATGYLVGNIVSELGKTHQQTEGKKSAWFIYPDIQDDGATINAMMTF
jgi:hypothetical protein